MKYLRFVLVLIIPALFLSSCKKSSDTPTSPLSFKVNGKLVQPDTQDASLITQERALTIEGYRNGNNNAMFTFIMYHAQASTYDVVNDNLQIYYRPDNSSSAVMATSGTVTITSISTTEVSGTFQFTAGDFKVTDGKFNIKFSVYYN